MKVILYYRIKDKLHNIIKRRFLGKNYLGKRLSRPVWESQFSSGYWDYLYSPGEKAHYLSICQLYKYYTPKNSILDIGCGQGVLYHYLTEGFGIVNQYLGVDISLKAVNSAKEQFNNGNFIQLDFDKDTISEKFDVIIFNETLYYFNQPLKKIEECTSVNLNKGGHFIISMYKNEAHDIIWQKLEDKYEFLNVQEVENERNQKWKVAIFKPMILLGMTIYLTKLTTSYELTFFDMCC